MAVALSRGLASTTLRRSLRAATGRICPWLDGGAIIAHRGGARFASSSTEAASSSAPSAPPTEQPARRAPEPFSGPIGVEPVSAAKKPAKLVDDKCGPLDEADDDDADLVQMVDEKTGA
jgi:hypothetical protein